MKQVLFIIALSILFSSCQEEKRVDNKPQRLIKVKNLYSNLKKEDLTKFRDVDVLSRYFDVKNQRLIISSILIYIPNDSLIAFHKDFIYGNFQSEPNLKAKLKRYASFYNIKSDMAYDSCKNHVVLLKRVFLDNKLIRIKSNGEFTEFYLNVSDRLIYKPDSIVLTSKYWQIFFEKCNRFDDNWYYQISDKILLDVGIYNTNTD
jgi:hypothetical protein